MLGVEAMPARTPAAVSSSYREERLLLADAGRVGRGVEAHGRRDLGELRRREGSLILAGLGRVDGIVHRPELALAPGAAHGHGGVHGLLTEERIVAVDERHSAVRDP